MSPPTATPQSDEAQDSRPETKTEERLKVQDSTVIKDAKVGETTEEALPTPKIETATHAPETRALVVGPAGESEAKVKEEHEEHEEHQNGTRQSEHAEQPDASPHATTQSAAATTNATADSVPGKEPMRSVPTPLLLAEPNPGPESAAKSPKRSSSLLPPPLPPKDDKFLTTSNTPSRATSPISPTKSSGRNSEDNAAAEYTSNYDGQDEVVDDSAEIQSIMEQFDSSGGPRPDDIMSPRLELASPHLESPSTKFPPRRSSLVPHEKPLPTPTEEAPASPSLPPRTSSLYRVGTNTSFAEPTSPSAHAPKYQPVQPAPEPEPDLPFDFHRFLEQLRHRTADPVAKFLRSFLLEFGKKQWMVHEQVKIIADFLEFITKKMAQCDVWRTVSDAEFDNAREGMEKLVMNRLYAQTFSPVIPPPRPVSPRKGRRRQEPPGPGRRGQHQEDVERDGVLAQKVRIYKWVKEDHLDIKPVGEKGQKFLHLAQQELLKIKSYRAPRDKIICILNCCKVIFGFLRTSNSDQSADAFVPLLIYTVLQANPDHLVSNVQYILRFRNQEKLGGEAGYYISSLMGAVQFIEGLDKTSLTVSDEEFDRNVEAAVSAIAERLTTEEAESSTNPIPQPTITNQPRMPSPHYPHVPEKATPLRPELTQKNSMEGERAGPRRSTDQTGRKSETDQPEEEHAAVAGLLRTIQRPLSMVGRMFSDNDTSTTPGPAVTPQPGNTPRTTPQVPSRLSTEISDKQPGPPSDEQERQRQRLSAEDAAARQASAEAEQAKRIQQKEHKVIVETLAGMFPQLDRDVIDDVVRQKEGRVGLAVDACLALANP